MFEQTRQHYLKQMGVTVWYSRCELPGAAASPDFLFGDNLSRSGSGGKSVSASADVLVDQQGAGKHTSAPKSAAEILNTLSAAKPDSKANSTVDGSNTLDSARVSPSIVAESDVVSTESAQFDQVNVPKGKRVQIVPDRGDVRSVENLESINFMLWVGSRYWFLSDNDSEYPEQLKRDLLLNIATALGEAIESTEVTYFKWPFFSNKRLPGNESESMLGLLTEWIDSRVPSDCQHGFLMGKSAADLLLPDETETVLGRVCGLNISDERDVKIVTTLSLNELLREPLTKRTAWQHLSPFRI